MSECSLSLQKVHGPRDERQHFMSGSCWGGEIEGARECRSVVEPSGVEMRYLVRPAAAGGEVREVHASEVMGRATAEWSMHMKCYRVFDRYMRGVQGGRGA